jgi:exosortase
MIGIGRRNDAVTELSQPWTPRASDVVAAALVTGALGWAYAPSFAGLIGQWWDNSNYSYGFLVVPIALVIFWSRRGLLDRAKMQPHWWGFLPLIAVIALRYPIYERNEQYVETATLPLVVGGLLLAFGGWHLLRVALPAVLFLFFMLPLPPSLNQWLAGPLQKVATDGSVMALQMLGMPVLGEGNVILIGENPLEVARACNGLSMLLSFVVLITAAAILLDRSIIERVVMLLSVIPIALASNIIRITATALAYHWFGAEFGEKTAHWLSGWLMMPLGILMLWIELKLMSWLVVEVEEVDPSRLIFRSKKPAVTSSSDPEPRES